MLLESESNVCLFKGDAGVEIYHVLLY